MTYCDQQLQASYDAGKKDERDKWLALLKKRGFCVVTHCGEDYLTECEYFDEDGNKLNEVIPKVPLMPEHKWRD